MNDYWFVSLPRLRKIDEQQVKVQYTIQAITDYQTSHFGFALQYVGLQSRHRILTFDNVEENDLHSSDYYFLPSQIDTSFI